MVIVAVLAAGGMTARASASVSYRPGFYLEGGAGRANGLVHFTTAVGVHVNGGQFWVYLYVIPERCSDGKSTQRIGKDIYPPPGGRAFSSGGAIAIDGERSRTSLVVAAGRIRG